MNRPLSTAEVAAIATAHPIIETPPPVPKLTRREKLLMLADLIEQQRYVKLYSNLELWSYSQLGSREYLGFPHYGDGVFALASRHPPFLVDGLDDKRGIGGVMSYLELPMEHAHAFSCDCGGVITPDVMARRVRVIAGR